MQTLGVTQEEIKQVLDEFDTNNDGEIDYNGTSSCLMKSNAIPQRQALHALRCRHAH